MQKKYQIRTLIKQFSEKISSFQEITQNFTYLQEKKCIDGSDKFEFSRSRMIFEIQATKQPLHHNSNTKSLHSTRAGINAPRDVKLKICVIS